mmetsp:Transcript_10906/g.14185  ORF Transcript_10906/g.14185 Transcript_10906/m.14185 type:complete len:104 (+) Transcript_10906:14-325(+)
MYISIHNTLRGQQTHVVCVCVCAIQWEEKISSFDTRACVNNAYINRIISIHVSRHLSQDNNGDWSILLSFFPFDTVVGLVGVLGSKKDTPVSAPKMSEKSLAG